MANFCSSNKDGENLQDQIDESIDHDSKNLPISGEDKKMMNRIADKVKNAWDYTKGTSVHITEKEMIAHVKELYGKDSRREQLIATLSTLLNANPGLVEYIQEQALLQIHNIGEKRELLADFERTKEVNFSLLPEKTLNILLGKLKRNILAGTGENLGKGFWGKLIVQLSTVRNIGRSENTGAIHQFSKALRTYTQKVAIHTSRFIGSNIFKTGAKDGGEIYTGVKAILDKVKGLSNDINLRSLQSLVSKVTDITGEDLPESHMVDLFWRIDKGWMKWVPYEELSEEERNKVKVTIEGKTYTLKEAFEGIYHGNMKLLNDKNGVRVAHLGSFKIANTYRPVTEEGETKKYMETGDAVYAFQDYVLLQDYKSKSSPVDSKGNEVVPEYGAQLPMDDNYKEMISKLSPHRTLNTLLNEKKGLLRKMQEIHDKVYEDMTVKFEGLKEALYTELRENYFPELSDKEIKALITEENYKDHPIYKKLSPENQENLDFLNENFTKYVLLDPFVFGTGNPDIRRVDDRKKRNFSPTLYEQYRFQTVLWLNQIEKVKKQIKLALVDTELSKLEKRITVASLSKELSRMEYLRDRFDNYLMDSMDQQKMPLSKDTSHLRHISNAFDIREGRRDDQLYYDYLRQIYSSYERGNLALQLIKSIRIANSRGVKKTLISQYKRINNDPTGRAGLLWINYDMESVTGMLKKVGIKISPESLERKLGILNSWISGLYLRRFTTAGVNYSAVMESFFKVGSKNMKRAYQMIQRANKQGKMGDLESIIKESGIVEWREFISQSLMNKGISYKLTQKSAKAVLGVMWKYWKSVERAKGNSVAEKKARETLRKELAKYGAEFSVETLPSKEQVKARRKKYRDHWLRSGVNTFANYAINKQYEMQRDVKNIPYRIFGNIVEAYTKIVDQVVPLTMGKTEESLRTIQFLVSVIAMQDAGALPADIDLWDMNAEQLNTAITIGTLYLESAAFQVGREGLGEISGGAMGAFITKFKIWGIQKFASDKDKIRDAYIEVSDALKQDSSKSDIAKNIGNLLSETFRLWKHPQKDLRTKSPNVAVLRSWLLTQGLFTALMDFFIMGPLTALPFAKRIMYRVPYLRTLGGGTSDLITLSLLIPNLAFAWAMGDDDEEDLERIFNYYTRKTFLGWGAHWTFDNMLLLFAMLSNSTEEEKAKRIVRSFSPAIPPELRTYVNLEDVVEELID